VATQDGINLLAAVVALVATAVAFAGFVEHHLHEGKSKDVGFADLDDLVHNIKRRWQATPVFLSVAAGANPLGIQVCQPPSADTRDLRTLLERHRTIILRDVRGSGKSTALRQVGVDVARDLPFPDDDVEVNSWLLKKQFALPLQIYLARWAGGRNLEYFLVREFQEQYQTTAAIARLMIKKARYLYLLLDGFDEVHDQGRSDRVNQERRKRLLKAIAQFRRKHSDARIVLASTIAVPQFSEAIVVGVARPNESQIASLAGDSDDLAATLFRIAHTNSGEPDAIPLELDLACFAYENGLEIANVPLTSSVGADDRGAERSTRIKDLLDLYAHRSLKPVSGPDRRVLRWLAIQLKLRGNSAIFRPSELDPFWLPHRRNRYLAFAVMGCAVMVLPATVAVAIAALLKSSWWICLLIELGGILMGANYAWIQRFVYSSARRRRPLALEERSFRRDQMWTVLANDLPGFFWEASRRLAYGLIGGGIFAGLRVLIGGISPAPLGNVGALVIGVVILCLATAAVDGALGQFIAIGVICALWHVGSGSWLMIALKTGIPAAVLSTMVFHLAELGETAKFSEKSTYTTLRRNVRVQAKFELAQWLLVGALFGPIEAGLFRDHRWLLATLASVLVAGLFYGIMGGAFPWLYYLITEWRLRSIHLLDGNLQDSLDRLVEHGLLQREAYGLGLRFIHPTIADAITRELEVESGEPELLPG